jgi:hypothetical protein
LKINFVGLIGGILAFISLVLPWWTLILSFNGVSTDISMYPYQISGITFSTNFWYGWAALALIIVAGILGILASIVIERKLVLIIAGAIALLSIIIFAVGLQMDLPQLSSELGITDLGLFSSGSFGDLEISWNYSAYLSLGFWLALISAIIMLIAALIKEGKPAAVQPPPTA